MPIQTSVLALHVADGGVIDQLRDELAHLDVRIEAIRSHDGPPGWTVALESHDQTIRELEHAIAPWLADGRVVRHALEVPERMTFFAGADDATLDPPRATTGDDHHRKDAI